MKKSEKLFDDFVEFIFDATMVIVLLVIFYIAFNFVLLAI